MNELAASLAREFAILAKDQGLITSFTIHSSEQAECLLAGSSEGIIFSALEMAYFLKGVIAGARVQRAKGAGG